jgi:NAD+ kinase
MSNPRLQMPSSSHPVRVERISLFTHGRPERIGDAATRVERLAERLGIAVVDPAEADMIVVLGGDGTMLRALQTALPTEAICIGVNFGRVGFLTAVAPDRMEAELPRVFAGDYSVIPLPTLEVEVAGETHVAVNDAVITSGAIGRIVELGYSLDDEDLGSQRCDGLICATPQGSTAYNLSNGGPVLVWGLDAMVLTFVAPHALHVRPLVVPRGPGLTVTNHSPDVSTTVIVDGHAIATLEPGARASLRIGARDCLLATLPDVTFFKRYAATFGH